jgi:PRTRC genetic system protein A
MLSGRPLFPVYLKTADLSPPTEAAYFLVARNGVFVARSCDLFASVTPVTGVAGLGAQSTSITLNVPRIPGGLLAQILGFFQFVYQRWEGEAVVFIFYSPARREFRLSVPGQRLRRYRAHGRWHVQGSVEYRSVSRPEGFVKLGDAHSHCACPAFFSTTDDLDDRQDGLRVVIGRLDRGRPDVCVSFVAGGVRFPLETDEALEDFGEAVAPPREWRERVTVSSEHRRHGRWRSGRRRDQR